MVVWTENGAGEPTRREAGENRVPVFTGSLDSMLGSAPVFRSKLRGYDPMEVDTYVSWAESELRSVRRQVDDLLARFGACSAELEISRRLLADGSRHRVVFPVSDRVEEMLQLAVEEAAAITETAVRDAEHVVAEARSEADARLRKAHEIKEMAVLAADELRDHAGKQRAEAQDVLDRARAEAAELLRTAGVERDRLAAAAARERDRLGAAAAAERRRLGEQAVREREQATAAATARLTALQEQVAELRRRHDEARRSLRGLSSRIGEALEVVASTGPVGGGAATEANIAVEGREYDPAHVGSAPGQRATGEGLVLAGPTSS
ncbi:DivIVA protein [Blastococcus aggregatus]|uniref:DivIVA protein n=1 Tax=Blastococcus aggregatus TaxID=38502 RepID=A0A285V6S6_9ACTN|nr:DivIVA domain-containing protein [Blastococcus aggregatus]SOC49749.1 DivIVA protein [Blastococcus aggregatus]